jgi:hypothetical protein
MKKELFDYLYERINNRDDVKRLSKEYNIEFNTLLCIYSQKYQEFTRKTLHRHRRPQNVARYYQRQVTVAQLSNQYACVRCCAHKLLDMLKENS